MEKILTPNTKDTTTNQIDELATKRAINHANKMAGGLPLSNNGTIPNTSTTAAAIPESLKNAIQGDGKVKTVLDAEVPEEIIHAFDPDDDELAGVTREELLDELGKTGVGIEKVTGKVSVDDITGETSMASPFMQQEELPEIESLQDLNVDALVSQMTEMAKQHLSLIVPTGYTPEQIEALIVSLETRLATLSPTSINSMTSEQVKEFVGTDIYDHMKKMDKHPSAALKHFLVDIRGSMMEKVKIIDTVKETQAAMEYFKNKPLSGIHESIMKELDAQPELYPTEYHKYREYLTRYMVQLSDGKDNGIVNDEIKIAQEKLDAVNDALAFDTIKTKLINLKADIIASYKEPKKIDATILSFIGFLNADTTMNIAFPVPKNFAPTDSNDAIMKLSAIWLLFLEVIVMYKQFPALVQLSHAEYYDICKLILTPKAEADITEYDIGLLDVIAQHEITIKHIAEARNTAMLVTYVIARIFKAKNLNNHKRYVLSYTMSMITGSMKPEYLKLTHSLIDVIMDSF